MSTQSIIQHTEKSILKKVDNFYICLGKTYLNHTKYGIGELPDMTKFKLVSKIDTMLESTECFDRETVMQKLNSILIK